jgi:two-component system, cell cycle sensor histidine kinase and response regulator CckA
MQNHDENQAEPRTYEIPDDPSSVTSKSVLILEDDAALADTVKRALEEQDYRVTVVSTGAEGVQRVLLADYDAIVCDMVMPNFPGDMFYRAVKQARPHLCERFIFITGHKNEPKVDQFLAEVRGKVLWKPFEMRQLFDALETATGRSN